MTTNSDPSQIESLIASLRGEPHQLSANAGSLIYSQEQSSGQYLLLLSGSVRLIDQSRTFGSLTIGKLHSPQIFGIEQLLSVTAPVEIRCATQCSYILLDPLTITEEQKHLSKAILANNINPSESIAIFSSISNTSPQATQQWETFQDVLKSASLLQNLSLIHI